MYEWSFVDQELEGAQWSVLYFIPKMVHGGNRIAINILI